jgi:hypothetical protein
MKITSFKTIEPVQVPGDFSSFFTLSGTKRVECIELSENFVWIFKEGALVAVPLNNVAYLNVQREQEVAPKPEPEQESKNHVKQKARTRSA